MHIQKKDKIAIYEYLFKEGVMVAKKDCNAPKHMQLVCISNLTVLVVMNSLKSLHCIKEQFTWGFKYWVLTNKGIQYLREYLHLPPEIVPSTWHQRTRPETARVRGGPPMRSDMAKGEDRAAYRRAPGVGGGPDKKADAGAGSADVEFRGGFGRGRMVNNS